MACNQGKISHSFVRLLCVSFNASKLDINSQQLHSFNIKQFKLKGSDPTEF